MEQKTSPVDQASQEKVSLETCQDIPPGTSIVPTLLCLLARENAGELGSTNCASALKSWLAIFHGNLVRIFHVTLFFAFDTIGDICHGIFPPYFLNIPAWH
jgi:hypothetical protein